MFQMTHSANLGPLGCKFKAIVKIPGIVRAESCIQGFLGPNSEIPGFSSLCEPPCSNV